MTILDNLFKDKFCEQDVSNKKIAMNQKVISFNKQNAKRGIKKEPYDSF